MISLIVKEETGSTSDDLWKMYDAGTSAPLALLALRQTGGRGRHGRSWFSDIQGGLYLSVLLFLDGSPQPWMTLLPFEVSLRVMLVLRGYTDLDIGVKWPNDLMIGARKFGGILVETRSGAVEGRTPLVAGIGLNLNSSRDLFPGDLRDSAACLGEEAGRRFPLIDIAVALMYDLHQSFPRPRTEGGSIPGDRLELTGKVQ
jgi:BirA family biotin operon repressor/biotin-[acetyl-CoA-carboxylase] ligase